MPGTCSLIVRYMLCSSGPGGCRQNWGSWLSMTSSVVHMPLSCIYIDAGGTADTLAALSVRRIMPEDARCMQECCAGACVKQGYLQEVGPGSLAAPLVHQLHVGG